MKSGRIALSILFSALIGLFPVSEAGATDSVVLLAAGDIGDCRTRGAARTAALIDRLPGTVLALGDLAYRDGTASEFTKCFDPFWGRHKARIRPAAGNHDYHRALAAAYFTYWGGRAGHAGEGYYSFDEGTWHLIALNSNIAAGPNSAQAEWLQRDLAETTARCVLAFWHHPLFASGKRGDNATMRDPYRILYAAGASIVIAGHEHNYERFAELDPHGRADPARGIRSFIAGTGGAPLYDNGTRRRYSEFRKTDSWGVLQLTLHPDRYDWAFVTVDGGCVDGGSAGCVERH